MKPIAILLVLAIGVSAVGCGGKETGGAPEPVRSAPLMTKFRIGRPAASGQTVTVETDYFGQGDPISVSFEVKNVPPKSLARVVWSDSSNRKISEEQKPLAPGTGAVSFEMKGAADLATGNYSAEFFYGGDPGEAPGKWSSLGGHSIRVGPKRASY